MASRPWREIAQDLAEEKDSDKLAELAKELCRALDEQIAVLREQNKPDTSS